MVRGSVVSEGQLELPPEDSFCLRLESFYRLEGSGTFWASRGAAEPPRAAQGRPEAPGAAQRRPEPPRAAQSRPGPPRAAQSRPEPPRDAQRHLEPPRGVQSRPEAPRAAKRRAGQAFYSVLGVQGRSRAAPVEYYARRTTKLRFRRVRG